MPVMLIAVKPNQGGKSFSIRAAEFNSLADLLKIFQQIEAKGTKKAKKSPAKKPAKKKKPARG